MIILRNAEKHAILDILSEMRLTIQGAREWVHAGSADRAYELLEKLQHLAFNAKDICNQAVLEQMGNSPGPIKRL